MPAPTSSAIQSAILGHLNPPDFPSQTSQLVEFVSAIATGVASAWSSWQSGLTGCVATVSGSGIGVWAGSGANGTLTEGAPFTATISIPFSQTTAPIQQLVTAIKNELQQQFHTYATSYQFASVPFTGGSTATPVSPGNFTATNKPGTLSAYKQSATIPTAVASGIQGRLTSPFNFSNGASKLPQFLAAIEQALQSQFSTWESGATFSGDTASGASAPATGTGSGTSSGTGTIS